MRCVIFCDTYKKPYRREILSERFELVDYLKTKTVDFTFGLGSGMLFALYLVGAYDKKSTEVLIEKRDALIFEQFDEGVLAKVDGLSESNLDLWLNDLGEAHYLRKVDTLSESSFLVSGDKEGVEKLKGVGEVAVLRKGALHTILAKSLISPYAEALRKHEIHPFAIPLMNTRNIGLMKQAKVAQELVDSLTLPQHFYQAFLRVHLLGGSEFYLIGDELGLEASLKEALPRIKIATIDSLDQLRRHFE